jgi:signal transduction histidine kinase
MRRQLAQVLSEINVRDLALAKAVETVLEAQAKAQEASIAKSQFLANMSHELRTPLNAIIGYSEIVMEDLTSAKMQTQLGDLERIRAAGHHLLGLISEVLDLSKIEAGRLDIHPEPCDAAAIAREAVETVEVMAARQGSVCELIIEVADTTIVSDPGRLKQCLLNLLSNAAKFTEKGRITLTMRRALIGEAQGLSFEVKDTGIGISPENLAKLFQPFVQVDGSRTRRAGGAGIGLVITKHLAQLLGGDIAVTSEVDVGSVFTLTIRNLHIDDDEVWIAA